MHRKKIILSIVFSFVAMVIIMFCVFSLKHMFEAKEAGEIQISIIDENNNVLKDEKITFHEGDKMLDLLNANFENVTIENGMVMTIEGLITPADWSYWICLYVDGEMSSVGILDVNFKDGTKIELVMTKFDYDY